MPFDPAEQALLDQINAATKETADRLDARANDGHPDSATADGHPDPWVAALVEQHLALIRTGEALACPHLHGSPQPVHAAAWMPGLLACDRCAFTAFNVPPPDDQRCDRCGTDTTGHGIWTGGATAGLITIDYGLCRPCFDQVRATMTGGT